MASETRTSYRPITINVMSFNTINLSIAAAGLSLLLTLGVWLHMPYSYATWH